MINYALNIYLKSMYINIVTNKFELNCWASWQHQNVRSRMREWRLLCASMTIESISQSIREMQPSALRWLNWLQWKATCYRSWQMWTCPVSCSVSLPASKVAFTLAPVGHNHQSLSQGKCHSMDESSSTPAMAAGKRGNKLKNRDGLLLQWRYRPHL